jgi:small subunit ribosomal protein S1
MTDERQDDAQERTLAEYIAGEYDYTRPKQGEIREAEILSITDNDIIVDLGSKRDGVIPGRDLQNVDPEYRKGLRVGDRIPVAVMRPWEDGEGIQVSLSRGLQQQDWLRAENMLESGELAEVEVTDTNRGGVIALFGELSGFIPNSHLGSLPAAARGREGPDPKEILVGQRLWVMVIEVNQQRRRLVLSRKNAERRRRAELLEQLEEGQVRTGVVRNIVEFGAFVDLGGVDGLIHISELDWKHVGHPQEVLSVGEEVEVYVLSVDHSRERVGLSRKRLMSDPWEDVAQNLGVGQVVDGNITTVESFGAFVDLGNRVEGLVHRSEFPEDDVQLEDLTPGMRVRVEVLDIDHAQRQIALRLEGAVESHARQ